MSVFFPKFVKKRTKKISQNKVKGRKTPKRKIVTRKKSDSFSPSIYSSIIIFVGLISLSSTIFLLSRQLKPVIRNERLKFLCTHQLGDKKSQNYKEAKLKLEKLIGDSDRYCDNFLLPQEKNEKKFRFFPFIKNILFRFM